MVFMGFRRLRTRLVTTWERHAASALPFHAERLEIIKRRVTL